MNAERNDPPQTKGQEEGREPPPPPPQPQPQRPRAGLIQRQSRLAGLRHAAAATRRKLRTLGSLQDAADLAVLIGQRLGIVNSETRRTLRSSASRASASSAGAERDGRIAVFGDFSRALKLMGSSSAFISIHAADIGRLDALSGGALELLIIGSDAAASDAAQPLVDEARALGACVIAPAARGLSADAALADAPDSPWLAAVDPRQLPFLPIATASYAQTVDTFCVVPGSAGASPMAISWPLRASDIATQGPALSCVWKVRDSPHLARNEGDRAEALLALAAAGVPVVAHKLSPRAAALLGAELADRLGQDFDTETGRDRHIVALRGAAYGLHGPRARADRLRGLAGVAPGAWPQITVLLPTCRPSQLKHLLGQVAALDYPCFDLVLALHGEGFEGAESLVGALQLPSVQIIRRPRSVVFGEVLRAASELAQGELLTKMDDDDWYSPNHLRDLVMAHDISGADLVGKTADFFYLSDSERTVRRATLKTEALGSRWLSGGALSIKRAAFIAAGGWTALAGGEDRRLIDDVLASGGSTFVLNGFGFLVHRHGANTWAVSDAELVRGPFVESRAGLAAEFAGV